MREFLELLRRNRFDDAMRKQQEALAGRLTDLALRELAMKLLPDIEQAAAFSPDMILITL